MKIEKLKFLKTENLNIHTGCSLILLKTLFCPIPYSQLYGQHISKTFILQYTKASIFFESLVFLKNIQEVG